MSLKNHLLNSSWHFLCIVVITDEEFCKEHMRLPFFIVAPSWTKELIAGNEQHEGTYSCQKAAALRISLEILWLCKTSRSFLNFLFASNTYDKWLGRKTLSGIFFLFSFGPTFCGVFPVAYFHSIVHIPQCFTYHLLVCHSFICLTPKKGEVGSPYCRKDPGVCKYTFILHSWISSFFFSF